MKYEPKGGLIGRSIQLVQSVLELHIPLYAANAGFFILLAVFPALVLVLGLLRYTHLEVASLVQLLEGILPDALIGRYMKLFYDTADYLVNG